MGVEMLHSAVEDSDAVLDSLARGTAATFDFVAVNTNVALHSVMVA